MTSLTRRTILLFLALWLLSAAGCVGIELNLTPKKDPLTERTIAGEGKAKVVMVEITGPIGLSSRGGGRISAPPGSGWPLTPREPLAGRLAEELEMAASDPEVKALLVKIDSPGGGVAASDLLHHQIKEFAQKNKIKVVVQLMGVAASGGYYVALAGDRILALPTTLTGSVGVISLKLDLSGLMGKMGVKAETFRTGEHKDMWSLFRPSSQEEKQIFQELMNQYFSRFKELVKKRRQNISPEQLARIHTGRVFLAAEALELGMIDGIAYPEEAFTQAKRLAGVETARLVIYHRPRVYRPNIYASGGYDPPRLDSAQAMILSTTPSFMYLWAPGVR